MKYKNHFHFVYLLNKEILTDTSCKISYLGEINVLGKKCDYIKFSFADIEQAGMPFSNINVYYAVDKKTFLPIQYETSTTFMGNTQYTKLIITKADFNQKKYKKELANFSVPAYFKDRKQIQSEERARLKIGDTIPNFTHQNLPNQSINFDSLTQEYILLDFWYVACFPCVLAAPFVDTLHQKYQNKNLFVVGVNPYDTSFSKIDDFKKRRNLQYPNVLIDIKTANNLMIIGYPTLAIIERKTRKVVYIQNGYSEDMKPKMIEFIEKNVVK